MFRRPVFWLATTAVCVAAGIFAFIYFPRAFPIVSLDIRMDLPCRQESLNFLRIEPRRGQFLRGGTVDVGPWLSLFRQVSVGTVGGEERVESRIQSTVFVVGRIAVPPVVLVWIQSTVQIGVFAIQDLLGHAANEEQLFQRLERLVLASITGRQRQIVRVFAIADPARTCSCRFVDPTS